MLISAFAALALFAAPEAAQSGDSEAKPAAAEAKGPVKRCYTATPSGSRMPRKVCVTEAPKSEEKDEAEKTVAKSE